MRKRTLSLLIAGTFLFGTAAACSDDDDSGDTPAVTTDDGGDSGDSGSSDNAEVQEYCDAAAEFAQAVEDANGDATALGDLSTQSQELATQAGDLAGSGLSSEDAQVVQDCTQQVTDAAAGLAGG